MVYVNRARRHSAYQNLLGSMTKRAHSIAHEPFVDTSNSTRTEYHTHIGAAACPYIHIMSRAEATTKVQNTMTRNILLKVLGPEESPDHMCYEDMIEKADPHLGTPRCEPEQRDKRLMF